MNRLFAILSLSLVFFCACSADSGQAPVTLHSGAKMGTTFHISIAARERQGNATAMRQKIDISLEQVDEQMSTYRTDSELARFNAQGSTDWYAVSGDFCDAVENALAISRSTGGAFDITVGPLVNLWGFGPAGSRTEPPADADIAAARSHTGYSNLETDCANNSLRKSDADLQLDLSGYAKGLAVDRVAAVLDGLGIRNYLVEIGGELRARGTNGTANGWRIAIEKPLPLERAVQRIAILADRAMATSGDYRNYFESGGRRYSHTIDPRSGRPVEHQLAAVTVIAESAAIADALATALLVMGPVAGPEYAEAQGIAALFLVHGTTGITEHATKAFDAVTPNEETAAAASSGDMRQGLRLADDSALPVQDSSSARFSQ